MPFLKFADSKSCNSSIASGNWWLQYELDFTFHGINNDSNLGCH